MKGQSHDPYDWRILTNTVLHHHPLRLVVHLPLDVTLQSPFTPTINSASSSSYVELQLQSTAYISQRKSHKSLIRGPVCIFVLSIFIWPPAHPHLFCSERIDIDNFSMNLQSYAHDILHSEPRVGKWRGISGMIVENREDEDKGG